MSNNTLITFVLYLMKKYNKYIILLYENTKYKVIRNRLASKFQKSNIDCLVYTDEGTNARTNLGSMLSFMKSVKFDLFMVGGGGW